MSKGPGHVQRVVVAAFADKSDDAFTTKELVALAYPGANRPEKKHRVAVLRAAKAVAAKLGWTYAYSAPGCECIFHNPCSARSYGIARMLGGFEGARTIAEARAIADGLHPHQAHYNRYRARLLPGGDWHSHVEFHQARRDGDTDKAESLGARFTAKAESARKLLDVVRGRLHRL